MTDFGMIVVQVGEIESWFGVFECAVVSDCGRT